MILGVTGNRPQKLGGYNNTIVLARIKSSLFAILEKLNPESVISGMAQGFDTYVVETCINMCIPFIAAIPFQGQELAWPLLSQRYYECLLDSAEEVHYVCSPGYAAWKMQARNQWIVDHCDKLLAMWDGTPGGTANCVSYAEKMNKEIIRLYPEDYI